MLDDFFRKTAFTTGEADGEAPKGECKNEEVYKRNS